MCEEEYNEEENSIEITFQFLSEKTWSKPINDTIFSYFYVFDVLTSNKKGKKEWQMIKVKRDIG